jgi:hypothetical protein
MLNLKPGVRITGMRTEILLAAVATMRVYEEAGHDFTITACVDGKHTTGSFPYAGAAIDVRTRELAPADVQKILAQIKACLGDDFDVVLEADHIHIEFQPKQALGSS